ncbi:MAG: hypothetical protein O8C63_02220 [Candidatus Methanoperedens sp.]|nr:hypothetical protein [Candidatus Methanoperedens sp.]
MKKKTVLVIGILGILLAVGGMSVAMAQNTSNEKTTNAESHECPPEMMEDMSKNCPQQMMQSETYEGMMNATNESSMMGNSSPTGNTETAGTDHCGGTDSEMGSMMGSRAIATKAMM